MYLNQWWLPTGRSSIPLPWNLVADELLILLSDKGYSAQGYADDIVILVTGNYPTKMSDLLANALETVEGPFQTFFNYFYC